MQIKNILLLTFLFFLATMLQGVGSLKDVQLDVPAAVSSGEEAILYCSYDLEDDPLYMVTWYRGRKEFFRFVPKELPHTRVFPLPGIHVDVSMSGPDRVVLRDVGFNLTGKYRCEVSADAPSFVTKSASAHMRVIPALKGSPELIMEKGRYALGDVIRGNCSSPPSKPPANITWFLNGDEVNSSFLVHELTESDKYVTTAGIEQLLTMPGRQRVICVADIYQLISSKAEVVLEEERPILASVRGTRESVQSNCEYRKRSISAWLMELIVLTLLSQR